MTVQTGEILIYKEEEFAMICEPLLIYIIKNKIHLRLKSPSSSLWRGYLGKWEIIDNKLYLTDITGRGVIKNDEKFKIGRLKLRKKLKQGLISPQENGHLLKKLHQDCYEEIELSLKSLFNTNELVFASWFTGIIIAPYGEILQYVQWGYGSTYENESIFHIKEGIVTIVEHRQNSMPQKSKDPYDSVD